MFETLRKPGSFIVKTGTIVGGVYAIRGYMRERLEDVREKMEEERRARETLRVRFSQTHEDVAYTILALLPTLSAQVLEEMDVDVLTRELQARSKARHAMASELASSSLASSIVQVSPYPPTPYPPIALDVEVDTRSEADSVAHSSDASEAYAPSAYHTAISASFVSERGSVTQSWVMDSAAERSRSPARSTVSGGVSEASADERLSLSYTSTTTNTTSNSEAETSDTRSKAELWNELKILTFTRTLTTLYASTLLSLLTTLQLTILSRGKYVQSIIHAERQQRLEDRMRERMERQLSPTNLLMKGVSSWVGSMMGNSGGIMQDGLDAFLGGLAEDGSFGLGNEEDEDVVLDGDSTDDGAWLGEIDDDLENKFLTMSWWLLHVGWKDVGERVRRAAEEVFNGVSLKTMLSASDLHRLIADIRRRVEHEVTFEGTEKRTTFLSSLLPPTPETIYHVLTQGGYTSAPPPFPLTSVNPNLTLGNLGAHADPALNDRARGNQQNGAGISTTSVTSSQLSLAFDNSPALAVSAHPHLPQSSPRSPGQGQRHPVHAGVSYLAPPPAPHYAALLNRPFLALLEETRRVLCSSDFASVLEVSLDRAAEVLFDGLEKNVFDGVGGGGVGTNAGEHQGGEKRIKLAGLLPGLARWSQLALEGLPNELVDKILAQREVSCLSAITFAKFEERFQ